MYRAEHVYIHKPAAVKVLHPRYFDNEEAKQRFLHEAQTASVINHPNIVGVNDFGEAPDGTVFLVMAHVDGIGLDRVLRNERHLPLFRSTGIINQVVRALGAAHAKGVVHRDLKPENIMLASRPGRREIIREVDDPYGEITEIIEPESSYDFATILDFGAAKFWHQSIVDNSGTVVGTPTYMAPETARTGIADARSDIYSVGVIFYEMLTGSVPFDADTPVEIMIKHVTEPVEPPRLRNPEVEITPEAERLILTALQKEPDARYGSMEELHGALALCHGRVRFRRDHQALPPGTSVESLRRPLQLTPDKIKPRPTPASTATIAEPTPKPVRKKVASSPIPLVKRKSGRHQTLPFGVQVGPPTAEESAADDTAPPTTNTRR